VIRTELAQRLDRGCAIGGGETSSFLVPGSEGFVVLLTKRLQTDPHALFEIWSAFHRQIPVVPVVITGGGYDFDAASTAFADLENALEAADSGSADVLRGHLADNVSIEAVGKLLSSSLTALIAVAWSPQHGKNHLGAIVDDILTRVKKMRQLQQETEARTGKARRNSRDLTSKGPGWQKCRAYLEGAQSNSADASGRLSDGAEGGPAIMWGSGSEEMNSHSRRWRWRIGIDTVRQSSWGWGSDCFTKGRSQSQPGSVCSSRNSSRRGSIASLPGSTVSSRRGSAVEAAPGSKSVVGILAAAQPQSATDVLDAVSKKLRVSSPKVAARWDDSR